MPTLPSGRLQLGELGELGEQSRTTCKESLENAGSNVSYMSENLNAPVSMRTFEMLSGGHRADRFPSCQQDSRAFHGEASPPPASAHWAANITAVSYRPFLRKNF